MNDDRPEPVDWKLCTCKWTYTVGKKDPVNARPTIIKRNSDCPELAKLDHG